MNFIKRFKSDKTFRLWIILIFIILVLVYGENGNKNSKKTALERKTQGECDVYNPNTVCWWDYDPITKCNSLSDAPMCEANGCWEGIEITDVNEEGCFDCVDPGYFVTNSDACCSEQATYSPTSGKAGYDYICKVGTPPEGSSCTDLQSQIGGILKSIPILGGLGCQLRFYAVAGLGGFLAFIFIMSAL